MKRTLASLLAASLILITPGPQSYQALAQITSGRSQRPTQALHPAAGVSAVPTEDISLTGPAGSAAGPLLPVAALEPGAAAKHISLSATAPSGSALEPGAAKLNSPPESSAVTARPVASANREARAPRQAKTDITALPTQDTNALPNRLSSLSRDMAALFHAIDSIDATLESLQKNGERLADLLNGTQTGPADEANGAGYAPETSGTIPARYGKWHGSAPEQSRARLGGVAAKALPSSRGSAASSALRRVARGAVRATAAVIAALTLFVSSSLSLAQAPTGAQPPATDVQATTAQTAAPQAPGSRAESVSPVSIEVKVENQGVTIGETMRLIVTLRNVSDHPVTLPSIRADLEDAIPALGDIPLLELRGETGKAPITLQAGETRELIFEVVPFDSGSEKSSPEKEAPGGGPQAAMAPAARPSPAPQEPLRDAAPGAAQRPRQTPRPAQATASEADAPVLEDAPAGPGSIDIEDATLMIRQPGAKDIEIAIPKIEFQVKSVLTPDWQDKGLADNFDVRKPKIPRALWLMAVPLAGLLVAVAARLLAARKPYKKPVPSPKLIEETRRRIAALESRVAQLPGPAFYNELLGILDTFLVDFYGLPKRQRGAEFLVKDIAAWLLDAKASGRWAGVHRSLAEKMAYIAHVAARAEDARSSEHAPNEQVRRADLAWLKALVPELAGPSPDAKGTSLMGVGALLLGTTLQFTSPWAALLLIPIGVYLIAKLIRGKTPKALEGVSSSLLPARKSPRTRFLHVPLFLRVAALSLLTVALSKPVTGFTRVDKFSPSTDTSFMIDVSGSMNTVMQNPDGKPMTQLQAAIESAMAYNEEQRRGTTNRLAVGYFDDNAYLPLRLTRDNDAVNSALKELKTRGSTAIGTAIMHAVTHFIEINILELSDPDDPHIAQIQEILDKEGVKAALDFAHQYPGLEKMVLQPQRVKVIILYTDGQSNTDIPPVEAAKIAKGLNAQFHIYTIGINTGNDQASEQVLRQASMITGAVRRDERGEPLRDEAGRVIPGFYRSTSPTEMKQALLDIARLEKSPVLDRKQLALRDYQLELALAALGLLALEQLLSATRLRGLPAVVLLIGMLPGHSAPSPAPVAPVAQTAADKGVPSAEAPDSRVEPGKTQDILDALLAPDMPAEMRQANRLYATGRFDEALKKYAEALAKYPDLAELYFNMGNAYFRMGDYDRATKSYQEYLKHASEPSDAAKVLFNMGNAALGRKDAQQAIQFYRQALEALRDSPDAPRGDTNNPNFRAQWNLQYVMKSLQQQDQQQQDGQGQQQKQKQKQKQKKNKKQKGQQQQQGQQQGNQQNDSGDEDQEGEEQGGQPKQGQPKKQQGDQDGDQQDRDKQQGMEQESPADAQAQERENALSRLGDYAEKTQQSAEAQQRAQARQGGKSAWGFVGLPLAMTGLGGTVMFANPVLMWALLAGVPIVILLMRYAISRKIAAARALDPDHAPGSLRSWPGKRLWYASAFLIASALAALSFSAGRPTKGEADMEHNFGGEDVEFVIGVSNSERYAKDGRFKQIKAEFSEFLDHLQGTDRIGLVVVAGEARTATPLTVDQNAVQFKLRRLEHEALGLSQGSRLSAGLLHALRVSRPPIVKKIGDRPLIIIVISDGELSDPDDKAQIQQAIKLARERHVPIYTIGVGSPSGSEMLVPSADGTGLETLIDPQTRQPAITKLDESLLRDIAEQTNGAYFRSSDKLSIDQILVEVAKRQQGEQKSVIKTPLLIMAPFLSLAWLLLLIEAQLRQPSLLRKGPDMPQEPKKESASEPRTTTLGGFALLGVSLGLPAIPLSAWPLILAALVPLALLAGLLFVDTWKGGALARRAYYRLRGIRPGPALVARDLDVLFDLPDSNLLEPHRQARAQLRTFLSAWKSANASGKQALLEAAQADRELWREKLVAAFLCESSPESVGRVLSALDSAAARHPFAPLDPVLRRVLEQRKTLDWLNHPRMPAALSRLANRLDDQNPRSGELRRALTPFRASWLRRACALALAAPLALVLAILPVAAQKTQLYQKLRDEEPRIALNIFYGDYSFIFTDQYRDPSIAGPLDALRRWNESGEEQAARLHKAVRDLRSSSDPKADNVLAAMFDRADSLAMTDAAKDDLLQALLERDNENVWKFLREYMQANARDPRATPRLLRMIELVSSVDNPKAFEHLFNFLASPRTADQTVVEVQASQAISASLARLDDESALNSLSFVLQQRSSDADTVLWVETFLLDRVSRPDFAPSQFEQASRLLFNLLFVLQRHPEPTNSPTPIDRGLNLLGQALDQARQAGPVPDVLAYAAQEQIFWLASSLAMTDAQIFPQSFREALERRGVLFKMQQHPENSHGGPMPQQQTFTPRRVYTRLHLWYFLEEVKETKSLKFLSPYQEMLLESSERMLGHLLTLADKSGVAEGNNPGELAAQSVNYRFWAMPSSIRDLFHAKLVEDGLAPKVQRSTLDPEKSYLTNYSPEQIEKIRLLIAESLEKGALVTRAQGRTSLDWQTKSNFAQALSEIEAVRKDLCVKTNAQEPATSMDKAAHKQEILAKFSALGNALYKEDAAALEQASKELSAAFDAAWSKDLFLQRLFEARAEIHQPTFRTWAIGFLTDKLIGPHGGKIDPEGAQALFELLAESDPYNAQAVWSDVVSALDRVDQAKAALPIPLKNAVQTRLNQCASGLILGALNYNPQLEARLLEAGVVKPRNPLINDFSYVADSHGKVVVRGSYGLAYLRRFDIEWRKHIGESTSATERQRETDQETLALLDSLIRAGERVGLPEAGTAADLAADEINDLLESGNPIFSNPDWDEALEHAGLRNGKNYLSRYEVSDIRKAHRFLSRFLETGQDLYGDPIAYNQTQYTAEVIEHLDHILEKYYPESRLKPAPLGRILLGLKNADAAAQASADQAARKDLDAVRNSDILIARLLALQTRHVQEPAIQTWIASYLTQRLSQVNADELLLNTQTTILYRDVTHALAALGQETEAWAILDKNLSNGSPLARVFMEEQLTDRVTEIIWGARTAWPVGYPGVEAIDPKLISENLLGKFSLTRSRYSQRNLRDLLQVILAMPASSPDQIRIHDAAMKILPLLQQLAPKIGLLPGDTPGEKVAQEVNSLLLTLHNTMGGNFYQAQYYITALRSADLAPEVLRPYPVIEDYSFAPSYSMEDLRKLIDFHEKILASGMGWNFQGPRALDDSQKTVLRDTLSKLKELVKNYPQASTEAPEASAMHGFLPYFLAMIPGATSVSGNGWLESILSHWPTFFAAAAAAFTAYLLFDLMRLLRKTPKPDPSQKYEVSQDVIKHYKSLDERAEKVARAMMGGSFRSRFVGLGGTEFADIKEYQGEGARYIAWRLLAKTNKFFIKRHEQPKDMPLILAVDLSASSSLGTRAVDKRDVIKDTAALLALIASRRNVRVGAVFFTDRIEKYIPARSNGPKQAWAIIREMARLQPKGRGTDLRAPLDLIGKKAGPAAMVAVISDFIAPPKDFSAALKSLAARGHDVLPIRVTDPADGDLEKIGLLTVLDPEANKVSAVDTSDSHFRAEQMELAHAHKNALTRAFRGARIPITISTQGDYVEALAKSFQPKKK